jgi:hypothetical protein
MARSCRFERSLLSFEESEFIHSTHHPAIEGLDGEVLKAAIARLRDLRDKERTHYRHKGRESRGKGEGRGASFPGTAEKPLQRKQVFAAALKRANKEATRRHKAEAKTALVEAANRALTLRREGQEPARPPSGRTAKTGMQVRASTRRKKAIQPSTIGSITHATKISQAIRDQRV